MRKNKNFAAFISYSHEDEAFAQRLQRRLERFTLSKQTASELGKSQRPLGQVFRDSSDLGAATRLSDALRDALSQSDALIVICSPAARRSVWVNQEIKEYRSAHGAEARVLLIVTPDAGPGDAEDLFPPELGDDPPLAADARSHAGGERMAILRLIAGLLQTNLDEFIHRQQRQRQARMAVGFGLSSVLSLVMTVLAINAIVSSNDSQRRLTQSEDLIGFMLDDLRSQLAPLGQVRVMNSVGDKALDYFESLDDKDLTNSALLRKSRALYQIGEVYFELGEFEKAAGSFASSLYQARQLTSDDPENPERLFELTQAEFWVGYSALMAGDLDRAETQFLAYSDGAIRLLRLDPENPDWIMETFWASNNLGSLEMSRMDYSAAKVHFEEALRRIEPLIAGEPTKDQLFEQSTVYSWLGTANLRLGLLEESRESFEFAMAVQLDSENALYQEERAFQASLSSRLGLYLGDMELASRRAQEAANISMRLSAADPDSMELLYARVFCEEKLLRVMHLAGQEVDTTQLVRNARRLMEAENAPVIWGQVLLTVAEISLLANGESGLEWVRELLESHQSDGGLLGSNSWMHLDLSVTYAQLEPAGRHYSEQIIPVIESQLARSNNFELVLPLARGHLLLENDSAFTESFRQLEVAGARHPVMATFAK